MDDKEFSVINEYIEKKLGLKVVDTNINSLKRFLNERIKSIGIDLKRYIELLEKKEEELHLLINKITIGETYFFREEKYFRFLDEVVFTNMRQMHIIPKIWSAASSIGAEPISISLLAEKYWNNKIEKVKILATDVDLIALRNILENKFSKRLLKEDGKNFHYLIEKYSKSDNEYLIFDSKIIEKIEILRFNLVLDDYNKIENDFDIVFLCNILTYMDDDKKKLIVKNVVSRMKNGGILIMSSTDTAFIDNENLELKLYKNAFYFVKR
ncbi:MAG TPA: CheR family methyltransferase [Spirochaetota bacterium]|nr:CheR family methyltransferase [Spirochaetota bacterium]HOL56144.1 CheR family methyltransferase [Spirochaetota bacterium]HPP03997.1 CheR family methyltransferase [Spirochaetota bacterium]